MDFKYSLAILDSTSDPTTQRVVPNVTRPSTSMSLLMMLVSYVRLAQVYPIKSLNASPGISPMFPEMNS